MACVGWRLTYHRTQRRIDLAILRWIDGREWSGPWVPYPLAKARVRRFDECSKWWGQGHWMCDCGEPARQQERRRRYDDLLRAQVRR